MSGFSIIISFRLPLSCSRGNLLISPASTKMFCLYQGSRWFPPDISQALCSKLGDRRHEKDWMTRQTALAVNLSMLTFSQPAFGRAFFNVRCCFAAHCRQRKTELTKILHTFAIRNETFLKPMGCPDSFSFSKKNQQQKQSKLSLYETSFLGPYHQR